MNNCESHKGYMAEFEKKILPWLQGYMGHVRDCPECRERLLSAKDGMLERLQSADLEGLLTAFDAVKPGGLPEGRK
jgi:hypothetical protein